MPLDEVKLEYLEKLRAASYRSFNDRRSHEWKLSFSLWTAEAILVGAMLQPVQANAKFPFHGIRYGIAATIAGLVVILLHGYFSNGIGRASTIDKLRQTSFREAIEEELHLNSDPNSEIE